MWKWFPVPVIAAPYRQLCFNFSLAEIKGTFRAQRQRSGQKPLSSLQGSNKQAAEQMYEVPSMPLAFKPESLWKVSECSHKSQMTKWQRFLCLGKHSSERLFFFFYHSGMCSNSQHCIATTTDRLNDVRVQISPFVPNYRLYIKVDLSPAGEGLQKKKTINP